MSRQAFEKAHRYLNQKKSEMIAFSDYLAAHPELSEKEYESSRMMAEILSGAGFSVEYPYLGLPTAFKAVKRSPDGTEKMPIVAIMVEYDALPVIGHGCGHNLHGTMALYAGLAVGEAVGDISGEIRVIGTPAEETDGAKVQMADAGVFDDVDLAFMFHSYAGESFADYRALGIDGLEFSFAGQTSHIGAGRHDNADHGPALGLTWNLTPGSRTRLSIWRRPFKYSVAYGICRCILWGGEHPLRQMDEMVHPAVLHHLLRPGRFDSNCNYDQLPIV